MTTRARTISSYGDMRRGQWGLHGVDETDIFGLGKVVVGEATDQAVVDAQSSKESAEPVTKRSWPMISRIRQPRKVNEKDHLEF